MLNVRKAEERGHADHGWLNSHHTFSFANYFDPRYTGFGPLLVINDDTVAAGRGFPPHGHRDMEIVSYVLEGALEHKDNLGNGSVMRPGDVQRMSAGTGVVHSEFNASKEQPVHFLQIWIKPRQPGLPSGYEQKYFAPEEKRGALRLVASPDGAQGSVSIQQDAQIFATLLEPGDTVSHSFGERRLGWLHVARGTVELNGRQLEAGDGVAISDEKQVTISSQARGEVLLFDLPS
jgi:redox-sensitive bicupin YhaK (pirin superfamily)